MTQLRQGVGWQAVRLVYSLLLLLVAAASAALLLLALGRLYPASLPEKWGALRTWLMEVGVFSATHPIAVGLGSGSAGLLALAMFLRGFTSNTGESSFHVLAVDENGMVVVESDGIAAIVMQTAESVPGVIASRASIRGSGSSPVRIRVEVGVHPGADVKNVGRAARDAVRVAVQERVGVKVADVWIGVRVLPAHELFRVLR